MTTTINNEHEKNQGRKVLNAPNLRFPEFQGEWEEKRLSEIADLYKGNGISKEQLSDSGESCILYGELYTKYKSEVISEVLSKTSIDTKKLVRSKANDVIIPCSGETAEDIATARCLPYDDILLGGDLNIIRLHDTDGSFMSYQLNGKRKYDIAKVAQGVSVVHLYGEHLKNVKTYVPCVEEQKKIAKLLSLLDERIATQNKVIEDLKKLKCAIAERLFKVTNGEVVALSEVCNIQKGKQVNGDCLSETGTYYVMNGGTEPSGYYEHYNAPADTISISEGGNSCGYVQYNREAFWSGGHCYSLTDIQSNICNLYLYHYLKSKESTIMKLRIGTGLPNIQKKDLEKIAVLLPPVAIQVRISTFLTAIERKAMNEELLLSHFQEEKQYLLRQMFI